MEKVNMENFLLSLGLKDLTKEELLSVQFMLETAGEYNLTKEVKHCFASNIKAGYTIDQSVEHALYEWDL